MVQYFISLKSCKSVCSLYSGLYSVCFLC